MNTIDNIIIRSIEELSSFKFLLNKVSFDYRKADGRMEKQVREIYDHGNGATVLLYNKPQRTIILIRQLRIASYMNGNSSGLLIECCAGMLDSNSPEKAIKKEIEEETGYSVTEVNKVMQLYTSPGANTEMLHFYTAAYEPHQKLFEGGGVADEQEDIEVLEVAFDEAWSWVMEGKICDAKTVILLQYAKLNSIV